MVTPADALALSHPTGKIPRGLRWTKVEPEAWY